MTVDRRQKLEIRQQPQDTSGFHAHPTDLTKLPGTPTVQQAAREAVRLALLDANGPTGTFSNEDGPLLWR